MAKATQFSRRKFFKTSALASGALLGGAVLASSSCDQKRRNEPGELFHSKNFDLKDGVSGLLFSQIGYELNYPVRIVVRHPEKEMLTSETICRLVPAGDENSYQASCKHWGEIWGSHWWVSEFADISEPGEWKETLHHFAYGYLIPACEKNQFLLVP